MRPLKPLVGEFEIGDVVFRTYPGGYFAVSECGQVVGRRRKVLKPGGSEYAMVNYRDMDLNNNAHYVHHLVAAMWIGPAPSDEHEINHKNGIKRDNRKENLEWVTRSENQKHAVATGLNWNCPKRGQTGSGFRSRLATS